MKKPVKGASGGRTGSSSLTLVMMSIREGTRWGPLWVGFALVLLAGLFGMHALAPHDSSMVWMGSGTEVAAPAAAYIEAEPLEAKAVAGMGTLAMLTQSVLVEAVTPGATQAGELTRAGSAGGHHGAMDLCVVVLTSLLLLASSRPQQEIRGGCHPKASKSLRLASGKPPPECLRPSLIGLCRAQV